MTFAWQDSGLKAVWPGGTNLVLTHPRGIVCFWTVSDFLLDGIKGSILYPEPKRISSLINQIDLSAFSPEGIGVLLHALKPPLPSGNKLILWLFCWLFYMTITYMWRVMTKSHTPGQLGIARWDGKYNLLNYSGSSCSTGCVFSFNILAKRWCHQNHEASGRPPVKHPVTSQNQEPWGYKSMYKCPPS